MPMGEASKDLESNDSDREEIFDQQSDKQPCAEDLQQIQVEGETGRNDTGAITVLDNSEKEEGPHKGLSVRTISRAYRFRHPEKKKYGTWETIVLAYQTLGVVYGDLGTSPLYVFSSIEYPLTDEKDFLGVLSLIIWTLTLVALFKYVFIVLQADDHGEGGTFAVYSLLCQHANISKNTGKQFSHLESDAKLKFFSKQKRRAIHSKTLEILERSKIFQKLLIIVVMMGTCMVIGDGVLTPAISVLSAIVGIKSQDSGLGQSVVIAISVVILVLLFLLQRFGTSGVSFLFSPIMVAWFVSTGLIGIYNIAVHYPAVLKAFSPHYIVSFFLRHYKDAWVMLGAVVLCITGAEAMFADLGHFNRHSIQIAFSAMVYPSLILTYAGEAAYLIKNPSNLSDTFFKSTPKPVFWPMFVIATLAAIVASQALISATFSIIKQSMALNCFPRVKIIHTSKLQEGQIYSPEVNYVLMILCLAVVLGFRSGTQIGNAFGVAVIWVMLITTFLVTLVMLVIWNLPLPLILAFAFIFGSVEGVYMTSVMNKFQRGGWVPFAISALFLITMLCWNYGRQKKYEFEVRNKITSVQLGSFLSNFGIARVPGVCFFYSDLVQGLPPIISHYVRNVGSLHEVIVFVTVRHIPVKTVLPEERFLVDQLGFKGVYRCVARYGYMDTMNDEGVGFLEQIIESLKAHIMNLSCSDENNRISNGTSGLEMMEENTQNEVSKLEYSKKSGAVFVIGKTTLKTNSNTNWFEHLVIDKIYRFLANNCRSSMALQHVPTSQLLQVGMLYEV